ncbi:MAG: S1 RNA-binding domain-containing protein [Clostridia bacterium]|nr:S1 RNA-binding domain-containing protein [Clostridia bacterium]
MALEVGSIVEGKVSGITGFGAFVDLPDGKTGLVHISEVARDYVRDIHDHLKPNQVVKVKVLSAEPGGKISLSIKKAAAPRERGVPFSGVPDVVEFASESASSLSFEDKMARFKQLSDERMADVRRGTDNRRSAYHKGQ